MIPVSSNRLDIMIIIDSNHYQPPPQLPKKPTTTITTQASHYTYTFGQKRIGFITCANENPEYKHIINNEWMKRKINQPLVSSTNKFKDTTNENKIFLFLLPLSKHSFKEKKVPFDPFYYLSTIHIFHLCYFVLLCYFEKRRRRRRWKEKTSQR